MKKTRIALSLATVVMAVSALTALPAAAQPGRFDPFGPAYRDGGREANNWDIEGRLQRAQERIDRGRGNGITKKEARRLQAELDGIRSRAAQLRADGRLGRRDRDELDRRLDQLAQNTRNQRFD